MPRTWRLPERLTTDRLVLRAHALDDLDDLLEFHSDPEVVRYLPWPIRDREQTVEHLRGRVDMITATMDGAWVVYAVEELATASVVGEVLLKRVSADDGTAELGFAFARRVHGKGLAREATEAMIELGEREFDVTRFVAVITVGNDASEKLLARLGFRPDDSPSPQADSAHFVR